MPCRVHTGSNDRWCNGSDIGITVVVCGIDWEAERLMAWILVREMLLLGNDKGLDHCAMTLRVKNFARQVFSFTFFILTRILWRFFTEVKTTSYEICYLNHL